MSKIDSSVLPNRLNVYSRKGLVLVAEVHPKIETGMLHQTITSWKKRSAAMGRPINMLFEPFGVYFYASQVPVAFRGDEVVMTLGFGDAGDPHERPEEVMVGGTRYLMSLIGWSEVRNDRLMEHAKSWFEQVGGSPQKYLPKCPGSMGIAREWICALLRENVECKIERGLEIHLPDGTTSPVRSPISDATEQPGPGE